METVTRMGRPVLALRRSLWWTLESHVHMRSLSKRSPRLVPTAAELEEQAQQLRPAYETYVASVSRSDMAMSLETATYIRRTVREMKPRRVVDLGSGFSSFTIRSLTRNAEGMETWSVDDSPEWLEKTGAFLSEKGCSTGNLATWEELSARLSDHRESFDFVVHDLGNMQFRAQTLPVALQLARPGGIVILDDVHNVVYRSRAAEVLRSQGLRYYNLWRHTRDEFNRHAWLVIR